MRLLLLVVLFYINTNVKAQDTLVIMSFNYYIETSKVSDSTKVYFKGYKEGKIIIREFDFIILDKSGKKTIYPIVSSYIEEDRFYYDINEIEFAYFVHIKSGLLLVISTKGRNFFNYFIN